MPKIVQTSDGSRIQFSDKMSDTDIGEYMAKQWKAPQKNNLAPQTFERGKYKISPEEQASFNEQNASPDKVINFLRPMIAGGAGAIAGTAAAPLGPVGVAAAGAGAFGLTDIALQHAMKTPPQGIVSKTAGYEPGSASSALANAGESGVTNELLGGLTNKLARGVKNAASELSKPGSIVGDTMKDLGATYSQIKESLFGKKATISKWLEDVMTSSIKARQIEEAGTIGQGLIKSAGNIKDLNPNAAANDIQASLKSAAIQSKNESNRLGNQAVSIAETNPHIIMTNTPSNVSLTGSLAIPKIVNGPTNLQGAVAVAHKTLDDMAASAVPLSPKQAELAKVSREIISSSEVTDPVTGKVTHINPISFREAWNLKQIADKFSEPSQGTVEINDPLSSKPFYKTLSQAINDDIDNSIPRWRNQAPEALAAWKQAKAVVGERQALLNAPGDKLADIIDSAQTELPSINRVIEDPKQLQRAVSAGEVEFPSGRRVMTSTRQDFGAYKLKSMLDNSWEVDPTSPTKGTRNSQKLINEWNDPAFQDSKKILFSSQTRSNYDDLFKKIAITQQKQGYTGSYTKLWMARAGVTLAPALALGYITGVEHTLPVVGVGISAYAMGRMMTNPTYARAMAAAASGQPLNVSENMFARALSKALAGTTVSMIQSDGKEIKGTVDSDGKFTASGQ